MSITNTTDRIQYTGNNSTDVYSFPFKIFLETDLVVIQTDASTGVDTTLVLNTDYSVGGVQVTTGGTVLLSAGNLPTGDILTIYRVEPLTQLTEFRNQSEYYADLHENAFDKLTMIAQQQQDLFDRCLIVPASVDLDTVSTELESPEATTFLGWNSDADALINYTADEIAALSQLDTLTDGHIFIGNASNVPTDTAVTGDVTISNTGVTSISTGVIVNADVNSSAAISGSKINPDFGSQNVATTGTLASGAASINGVLNVLAQNPIRLQDTTGGEYVGLRASGTTTTHTLTMPAAAPSVNRVLMGGGSTATDLQWGGANTTFTPAVAPAAGAYSGLTYSIQKGNYIRLGDWIMFTIQIEISAVNINTASGNLNITGLPVAQKTDSGLETTFGCAVSNLNTSTGKPLVTARLSSGATTINLYESGDAVVEAAVAADGITGGSFNKKILISGSYPAV